jgi:hypothetical protein
MFCRSKVASVLRHTVEMQTLRGSLFGIHFPLFLVAET